MDRERTLAWVALGLMPGLGPAAVRRALARYHDPRTVAWHVPVARLAETLRLAAADRARLERVRRGLSRQAERELRRAERHGIHVLGLGEPGYPAALLEIDTPPPVLYVWGALDDGVARVGVVGSRAPTAYGRRTARAFATELAGRGVEVVSGGARGVDAAAHRAAIERGGRTVAVVGAGLLEPYPAEHVGLFEQISAAGAVVSEFPLEFPPRAANFPRRNRLISGLSAAVVVIEAAERSGSLITARTALDQGREVLAVPGPVDSVKSNGCNRLIAEGARPALTVKDVLEELSPMYRRALCGSSSHARAAKPPDTSDLTADENHVLGIVKRTEPVHLDQLVDLAHFGVARLQTALFGLEIRGAVERQPGRYYVLRPQ